MSAIFKFGTVGASRLIDAVRPVGILTFLKTYLRGLGHQRSDEQLPVYPYGGAVMTDQFERGYTPPMER
ncbi:MAG: hypothetical protein HY329_08415 [Chloroflexi bacterium]|nr:hypothetical protein [Chloroflexota bacterium]